MSAAEFRITRERLGLSTDTLSNRFDVHLRTIRRWEHGHSPVPDGIRDELQDLTTEATRQVAHLVAALEDTDQPTLTIPDRDTDWPASWWRMIAGRVTDQLPTVRVRYPNAETSGD